MTQSSEPLFRLIYACQASTECQADIDGALSDILAVAIPRNRMRGVTGLLIAYRGWFLHAVEGDEPVVRETLDFVRDDPRCHPPRVLNEARLGQRQFEGWSLAARILSPADSAVLRRYDPETGFDPTALPEKILLRLFAVVAEAHRARLETQQRLVISRQ